MAPRRIRPSLDFGVDKIMRYGVAQFVCTFGVGNSKTGVGRKCGEWMEWGCGYGVEIVVWEWGIRSGGVGVGVFIMPLQSPTCSTPLYPTPQSPTPPVSNQSPINQIQQSAVTRIACQLLYSARGVAQMMWAQLIRYLLEWGKFAEVSQHGTAASRRSTLPTELFCYDFWSGQN